MKQKLFLISILLCLYFPDLFSQNTLRKMVVVVRPVYSEITVKFLNDFSSSLQKDGYIAAADLLKNYAKGGFGSGFIYKNVQDGHFYIITNRHVVSQAKYVNIEIIASDKSITSCKKYNIVAIDEQLDLALVSLPTETKLENSLNISTEVPADGMDVYTAGYPGLGSEPSWQLGKGIISNSYLLIDELTNGSPTGIIQHTAQIDPGSSGGPLLIRSSTDSAGFKVIGINTWKVQGRENVNFALPASSITKFLDEYLNKSSILTKETLQKRTNDFIAATKLGYKKVLPFISYDYIANLSTDDFYELYGSIADSIRMDIIKQFIEGFPIEGVRIAIAEAICKKFSSKSFSFSSIENFSVTDSIPVNVILNQGTKNETSVWIAEQGRWRLINLSSMKFNSLEKNGISKKFSYANSIRLGYNKDLNTSNSAFTLTYGWSYFVLVS